MYWAGSSYAGSPATKQPAGTQAARSPFGAGRQQPARASRQPGLTAICPKSLISPRESPIPPARAAAFDAEPEIASTSPLASAATLTVTVMAVATTAVAGAATVVYFFLR